MINPRLLAAKILQKTRLNRIAHKIYYNKFHGFDAASKTVLPALEKCFHKSIDLETIKKGDYYEFGIFKGYSFWYAQKIANDSGLTKTRFFGFDSFSGLPDVKGSDKTKNDAFYEGQYSWPKENVISNLSSKKVDWQRTFIIDGFFVKSLNEDTKIRYSMDKIAIALIDCDLYSSTVEVLNFIENIIVDKTILIFDDWNCFDKDNDRGQRKAFREFLEKSDSLSAEAFFSYGSYGQAFIVNRNIQ